MNSLFAGLAPDVASSRTINDVLQAYPITAAVFNAFDIDSCCGGGRTLIAAAHDAGISPERLIAALFERVQLAEQLPADVPAGRAVRGCACGCTSSSTSGSASGSAKPQGIAPGASRA